MKKLGTILVVAGGAYLIYRALQQAAAKKDAAIAASKPIMIPTVQAIPKTAQFTGVIKRTTNNRPPNYPEEVIGYGQRDWAEVLHSDGNTSWAEVASSDEV